jgi:hypothetical protein
MYVLRKNVFNQGNRSGAIGFDLAETSTRPALECSDHVSINICRKKKIYDFYAIFF